ncbi:FkbM family methyltransferase [Paracoccaceae bacterium]|jgi:FkbM family methyltransferase|nr:FkbM family methyltransferase [Paracoccaceae bacterium]
MYIFDLGMNNGDDTAYYLKLGYSVVALEADPFWIRNAKNRFKAEIQSGMLILVNKAFSDSTDIVKFYVNHENRHWSSLNVNWASRNGSSVEEVCIQGIELRGLTEEFGVPIFIKIDIEGSDIEVLRQLTFEKNIPTYLSIEDCYLGYEYLEILLTLGYRKFCLSDQSKVKDLQSFIVDHEFSEGSSGPFGPFLPYRWYSWHDFREIYGSLVRGKDLKRLAPLPTWWDIHASLI